MFPSACTTGISLPIYPRYDITSVSSDHPGSIFSPNSPVAFVTVPFPVFFNPIVANGKGSSESESIMVPVIYSAFPGTIESVLSEAGGRALDMIIYLSIIV